MDTYVHRLIDDRLDDLLTELPAVMIQGPRACGKTTTALRRSRSQIRLDDPQVSAGFATAPDAILAQQPAPVLIDEWQAEPLVMGAIKRAVDTKPEAGRFLITGSVRSRDVADAWPATGRVTPVDMYGLTVGERFDTPGKGSVLTRLTGKMDPEVGSWDEAPTLVDYVRWAAEGMFPEALSFGETARGTWYDGYIDQLVHIDASSLEDIRNPQALGRLLRALALTTAGSITISSLIEAVGVNARTISRYLDVLVDLRVIEVLEPWWTNKFSRLVKAPTYHIVDPGMALRLMGEDHNGILLNGSHLGRLIETFVVSQIRPLLPLAQQKIHTYHLRTQGGQHEVDLILEDARGDVVGIEIKSAASVTKADARHLTWLQQQLGDQFIRGIVLHTGRMTFPLGDGIWAMPIAALWR